MKEILHHALGFCGEPHISFITVLSGGVIFIYKDFIINFIKKRKGK